MCRTTYAPIHHHAVLHANVAGPHAGFALFGISIAGVIIIIFAALVWVTGAVRNPQPVAEVLKVQHHSFCTKYCKETICHHLFSYMVTVLPVYPRFVRTLWGAHRDHRMAWIAWAVSDQDVARPQVCDFSHCLPSPQSPLLCQILEKVFK